MHNPSTGSSLEELTNLTMSEFIVNDPFFPNEPLFRAACDVPFMPDAEILVQLSEKADKDHRFLEKGHSYRGNVWDAFWNGTSEADTFTSQLKPAADISVDQVTSTLYFNVGIFFCMMILYEILRKLLPSVYAARKIDSEDILHANLPDTDRPLDWIRPTNAVSYSQVRKVAGLDAYFFLRYIRMCARISAVSTFWASLILIPVYVTGDDEAEGLYHLSMANIQSNSWRTHVVVIFMYLFTGYCFFVMKQEYEHYMELRMDFLGKSQHNVHPQCHYSLLVENIPFELRSDTALCDYFEKLFPNKVHSASVVMKLPNMEEHADQRMQVMRRLEKSIAHYHATGKRPTHIAGRSRLHVLGIEASPVDCGFQRDTVRFVSVDDECTPKRGTRVDSVSYYTRELAKSNRVLFDMQQENQRLAETGTKTLRDQTWFTNIVDKIAKVSAEILRESKEANFLQAIPTGTLAGSDGPKRNQLAENMTSMYGTVCTSPSLQPHTLDLTTDHNTTSSGPTLPQTKCMQREEDVIGEDTFMLLPKSSPDDRREWTFSNNKTIQGATPLNKGKADSRSCYRNCLCRVVSQLGLDFVASFLNSSTHRFNQLVEGVVGSIPSSTGFVTFLDLQSVTAAASEPLTHKPGMLKVSVAPEPRDVRWKDVQFSHTTRSQRSFIANVFLLLGVILWSIPLTAIQAFSTSERLSHIPGFSWVLSFDDGSLHSFINGYLPVVALLTLMLVLPIIFEWIAASYEHRKTFSDVQNSMIGRYFYYQLANIYITVTAGSLWKSLADILDHPSNVLQILGQSLPTVVGYFVSLLITKILVGLPSIILRVGALSRMLVLRTIFAEDFWTQRELDQVVYRREQLLYGYEYPTQLLVIVIVFTYVCISPIILPFGAIFFVGSLMVYKKQMLYVYTPIYESGGAMFPYACDRTLFGLVCGQLTLTGYCMIRRCTYEPLWLLPLPIITYMMMVHFREQYANPSVSLSKERAIKYDRIADLEVAMNRHVKPSSALGAEDRRLQFKKHAYRQPILALHAMEPMFYRRGQEETDVFSASVRETLRKSNVAPHISDKGSALSLST